jgi:hypothetical protein
MKVLVNWGLHKEEETERFLYHIVSDTTAVNPLFVKQMGYKWIPCACHLLHLVMQDALISVKPLLQRHRNIVCILTFKLMFFSKVRFFKKSAKKKNALLELQKKKKRCKGLIGGCVTRWSGTFDMLERYY